MNKYLKAALWLTAASLVAWFYWVLSHECRVAGFAGFCTCAFWYITESNPYE